MCIVRSQLPFFGAGMMGCKLGQLQKTNQATKVDGDNSAIKRGQVLDIPKIKDIHRTGVL